MKSTKPESRATMTIPEFCRALGIGRNQGYAAASKGELPVPLIRIGKRVLVSRAAVERLLAGALVDGRGAAA
jgi:excisionase family DNA binding protein